MPSTATEPNLYQLGLEIGGSPSLRMLGPYPDGTYAVSSPDVDDDTLAAALAEHVADPTVQPARPESDVDADRLIAAEEARRSAFDAYMQGKTSSVANVLAATRAGSDAAIAALS